MSFPESGIQAVVKDLDKFLSNVSKMDAAIQGVGSNTRGLSEWNRSISDVSANVAKVVTGAAVAGTAAITAFVLDSTKQSANLESALSGIAAVLNKGAEAVGPLKDLILDLGLDPSLKVSATEAAQAVELLARNGLSMTEIMDGAARSTVLLANATGADFGVAADIATDAMAIFNIEAADMNQAVNGITGVTTSSKFSINDYRLALAQAGGVAGAVGVSFDDFNTTIAGIAPLFASGSDAGTSFKVFLQRLIPASTPALDAMRDLGLFTGLSAKEFEKAEDKILKYKDQLAALDPTSKNYAERSEELRGRINALEASLINGSNAFFDANGQMKDMDEIAGILDQALSGLSEEKKNDALQTIFGTDAMRAAVGVAELGTKGYQALGAQIAEIDAGNQAKTRMDNLSGSLEILNGIVETLRIRIGDKFNPVFRGMVDQVSGFLERNADRIVNFFGKLADMVKVAIDRLVPLVESWLPKLEKGVEDGATGIEGMITKVGEITRYIADLTTKVIDIVKPMVDWITENYTLEDVLNGLTALVIVSLIPAITSLVTTLGPVIAVFGSIVELSSRMSEGQKGFAVAVGVAVFALPPLISAITTVSGVVTTLIGFISGAAGMIPALGALLNPIGLAVAAVAGLGLAWATDFGGIRTKTIEITGQVGQTISRWSADTVLKFRETQTQIGTTLAGWSTSLGSTLSNLSSQTGSTLSSWSSNVGQTFTNLRNNTQNTFAGMSSSIQSSATNLAAQSLIAIRRFETEGVPIFTKFRENAINKIGEMVRDVPQRLRELVDAGLRVFDVGRWVQAGADVIGGVMRGLQNAATAPLRWIENFAGGLISVFKSILKISSPSQVFEETGVNIMEGLQGGLTARSGAVLGFMDTFAHSIAATSAAAQRLADANFKALTDSATAAYNGFVATASGIATISQNIDAAAIAAQNAAQQAYVASLAPAPAADSGFGTGRVAQLTSQISSIVRTSFEQVGNTGIRSLGIDLGQFQSASQVESAIAQLRLLAGTIQQNAQVAPDVNDRNRLQSLFSDLSGRILPLLTNDLAKRQAETEAQAAAARAEAEKRAAEAAAKAAAEAAERARTDAQRRAAQQATSSFLLQAIDPLVQNINALVRQGANLFFSDAQIAAFDSVGRAAFANADQRLEGLSYTLSQSAGSLSSLSSFGDVNTAMDLLRRISEEVENSLGQFSNLAFLGLDQNQVNSRFGDLSSAYNLLMAAAPVLSGASTTVNNNVSVGSVNNGMDLAALQAYIDQAMARALP
jgi:ElaB/YqjD/DUF883 family membrane-anchored ribosome-binding protein